MEINTLGIIIKNEAFYKYAVLKNLWLSYMPWVFDDIIQIDSAHVGHIICMWYLVFYDYQSNYYKNSHLFHVKKVIQKHNACIME